MACRVRALRPGLRCPECQNLERAHDRITDQFLALVEQQSGCFEQGRAQAGRDLDAAIRRLRAQREAALAALLGHQTGKASSPSG